MENNNRMKAFLAYDDNGYDAIGSVYVIAAKDADSVNAYIQKRWGLVLTEVKRYWSVEPIPHLTVDPSITETTILND